MSNRFLSGVFFVVVALAASSDVAASTMYGVTGSALYKIDQDTADETTIGVVQGRSLRTLTSDWRASSFRLWAVERNSNTLVRLDPNTGIGTLVGPLSVDITSIAYDVTTDQLYGLSNDNLYRVDSGTAATTLVGPAGLSVFNIAFDTSGKLYGQRVSTPGASNLLTLNKSTGAATVGSTISGDYLDCFAFRPEDNVMFASAGDGPFLLFRVDTTTGIKTLVHQLTQNGASGLRPSGLAFSTVPEPSLLPFGILALVCRRKTRR